MPSHEGLKVSVYIAELKHISVGTHIHPITIVQSAVSEVVVVLGSYDAVITVCCEIIRIRKFLESALYLKANEDLLKYLIASLG